MGRYKDLNTCDYYKNIPASIEILLNCSCLNRFRHANVVLFKLHIFVLNLIFSYPQIEIVAFLQKKQTIYLVHPCVCVCV